MLGIEYHHTESSGQEVIFLRTGLATRHYPWHIHANHFTVGLVCCGTVTLGKKDGQRHLLAGEHFTVRPCEGHNLSVAPETELVVYCLDSKICNWDFHKPEAARLQGFQGAMDSLNELCGPFRHAEIFSQNHSVENDFQGIVQSLLEKPEKAFPIARMASDVGYSQWHFLRRFRLLTGMTPHAFHLACRLRAARVFLRRNAAAAEAAAAAGFTDQSHMHKVFKLHHGLTPRQFLQASFKLKQR